MSVLSHQSSQNEIKEIYIKNKKCKITWSNTTEIVLEALKTCTSANQNHYTSNKNFFGSKCRTIIAVGPTGFGKSLVCNRLVGDTSDNCKIGGEDTK